MKKQTSLTHNLKLVLQPLFWVYAAISRFFKQLTFWEIIGLSIAIFAWVGHAYFGWQSNHGYFFLGAIASWCVSEVKKFRLGAVSGSLTPFGESIKLLRDLADLQNGAPLEQHRQEWEETMDQVYDFLNRWEGQ